MTANLHVSSECKQELDAVVPLQINNEKITYDDAILAIMHFLKNTLEYGEHDIVEIIIDYKKYRLGKPVSNIVIQEYGN